MPPIHSSVESTATKIPATAGWLLLTVLLTSMLLLGHWLGPLPAAAPPVAAQPAPAASLAAARPAPAARPLAVQTAARSYAQPKPVLAAATGL